MKFVGVTSCPTGIAHTYMAAEALEVAAQEAGHEIVVETQGSAGSEPIAQSVIDAADAVIFAHDLEVKDKHRFAGKPVIDVGVKRAISDGPGLIAQAQAAAEERARNPQAAAAAPPGRRAGRRRRNSVGAGTKLRQWLMTGVSYMIPFVAAGGILIALELHARPDRARVQRGHRDHQVQPHRHGPGIQHRADLQRLEPDLVGRAAVRHRRHRVLLPRADPVRLHRLGDRRPSRPGPGHRRRPHRRADERRLPRRPRHRPPRRVRGPVDLRMEGPQGGARGHAGRRHPAAVHPHHRRAVHHRAGPADRLAHDRAEQLAQQHVRRQRRHPRASSSAR